MSTHSASKNGNGLRTTMLRYLDGNLSEEDTARLNEALRNNPDLQKSFADLLTQVTLLQELGKEPKTLTTSRQRPGSYAWQGWLAAAACIALLVTGWMAWRYPTPDISATISVQNQDNSLDVTRGSVLQTKDQPGTVQLGGYCALKMSPESRILLEGSKQKEQVYLTRGELTCKVRKEDGAFAVRTDMGTVRVQGTEFIIQIKEEGGEEMKLQKLFVKVLAGAVVLTGTWGSETLLQGQERTRVQSENPPKERFKGKDGRRDGEGKEDAEKKGDETEDAGRNDREKSGKDAVPKYLHGFSGRVHGQVVSKLDGSAFRFRVYKLLKVWRNNKAKNVRKIVGRVLHVGPRWVKGKNGRWHKVERHLAFIKRLKKGCKMNLEVRHAERDVFQILELSKEQRKLAEGAEDGAEKNDGEENQQADNGKIEAGKPTYHAKPATHWKGKGRIVGLAKNAPSFNVKVFSRSGRLIKKVRAEALKKGARAYEVWLKPGVYTLVVLAEGYAPLERGKLEVRANHDLRIDLEFTKADKKERDDEEPERLGRNDREEHESRGGKPKQKPKEEKREEKPLSTDKTRDIAEELRKALE